MATNERIAVDRIVEAVKGGADIGETATAIAVALDLDRQERDALCDVLGAVWAQACMQAAQTVGRAVSNAAKALEAELANATRLPTHSEAAKPYSVTHGASTIVVVSRHESRARAEGAYMLGVGDDEIEIAEATPAELDKHKRLGGRVIAADW